jgi:hypothetical protein
MRLIYIAGALRGNGAIDYIHNVHKMVWQSDLIRRLGFAVFVPCNDLVEGLIIPNRSFDSLFDNSMEILHRCDGVYVCPGAEKSVGVAKEVAEAKELGIPVFHDTTTLQKHFNMGLKTKAQEVKEYMRGR